MEIQFAVSERTDETGYRGLFCFNFEFHGVYF